MRCINASMESALEALDSLHLPVKRNIVYIHAIPRSVREIGENVDIHQIGVCKKKVRNALSNYRSISSRNAKNAAR